MNEKQEEEEEKEKEEKEPLYRATSTGFIEGKKTKNDDAFFGFGWWCAKIFAFALLFSLLCWCMHHRTSSFNRRNDDARVAAEAAMAEREDAFMRNLRYPGSTTPEKTNKKKYYARQKQHSVSLLVDTNSAKQKKEEAKREGRKLLQFLAPVRYQLVPLSDAIKDLCEAIFDLSITPLQAKIAPFLKFRETNVTNPKDPLVIDKEKVKEAIMKETLP